MIKCVSCLTETVKNAEFCHSCGAGVIDMVAYRAARDMAKDQPRTATARKVLANLSQRQAGRLKGLTKQAGRFLEDVPISSKTFPDQDTHRAAARLTDVLLDVMQFMRPLAEQTGDTEMLQIIDEVEQRVQEAHSDQGHRRQVLARHYFPVLQGQGHQQLHGPGTSLAGDQPHGDGGNDK